MAEPMCCFFRRTSTPVPLTHPLPTYSTICLYRCLYDLNQRGPQRLEGAAAVTEILNAITISVAAEAALPRNHDTVTWTFDAQPTNPSTKGERPRPCG